MYRYCISIRTNILIKFNSIISYECKYTPRTKNLFVLNYISLIVNTGMINDLSYLTFLIEICKSKHMTFKNV